MGEAGSGKSSIINLIADRDHAVVSNDSTPCTTRFVSYEVAVEGRTYRLWDTPGFNETLNSGFFTVFNHGTGVSLSSLKRFLQERRRRGELDLFVLSVKDLRDVLLHKSTERIPVVLAVTHLEKVKPTMDAWWHSHEGELVRQGMVFDGHACLTCLSPHELRVASQQAIHRLISSEYQPRALGAEKYLCDSGRSYCTI
ncbi:hypothetical protein EV363DRAFT_1397431 [Boletus edulis]|nr:hypothetical protein EV363DRAFT_1397431 [Boletus edulis]